MCQLEFGPKKIWLWCLVLVNEVSVSRMQLVPEWWICGQVNSLDIYLATHHCSTFVNKLGECLQCHCHYDCTINIVVAITTVISFGAYTSNRIWDFFITAIMRCHWCWLVWTRSRNGVLSSLSGSSGAASCMKGLVCAICCRTYATLRWQTDCAAARHSNRCQLELINFEILSFLTVWNILIRPGISLFSSSSWQHFECLRVTSDNLCNNILYITVYCCDHDYDCYVFISFFYAWLFFIALYML